MPECEFLQQCSFSDVPMSRDDEHPQEDLRACYRRDAFEDCARFAVFLARGPGAVPEDLGPKDRVRAIKLVLNGYESAASTEGGPELGAPGLS